MNTNEIEKRENEDRMLRYQYASRWYFNRAEKFNDLVWLFCIISWSAIFLPNIPHAKVLFISIPFFADVVAAIIYWRMNVDISSASSLRKYFDAYVLDININQFDTIEVQKLEELSIKAIKSSPAKSKIEMANTGRDNPHGVRNWYEFSYPLIDQEAVYECQKQNCWWNKKISRERIVNTGIGLLVFIPLVILFFSARKVDALFTIFSSGALILKCVERFVVNMRYYMLSLKIDGALEVLTNSRTKENIEKVQIKIDERRAMPVLGRNRIHKRRSKEYHELYHDSTVL